MDENVPNNTMFVYDRNYPPLFFTVPTTFEQPIWENSMKKTTREYFNSCRKYDLPCSVPLSNGSTTGEFAMHLIKQNHVKRNQTEQRKALLIQDRF